MDRGKISIPIKLFSEQTPIQGEKNKYEFIQKIHGDTKACFFSQNATGECTQRTALCIALHIPSALSSRLS